MASNISKNFIALFLNLPWTVLCLGAGLLSLPYRISINDSFFALIINVNSFWWYCWLLPGKRGIRGMVMGNVMLLGPRADELDLKHELVHIEQYQREPFLHLIFYWLELLRKGYRQNRYEIEAYDRAGNRYEI